jgi:kinesin family protein 2/24
MIAMISPGNSDVEHTLNTLRYADRVKELGTDETSAKKEDEEEEEYRRQYNEANGLTDSQEDEDDDYDDQDDVSHAMNDLQETLAELQDMEEQVLESHGDLIRDNHKWMT